MAKISLANILSGFNLTKINDNFQKIQDEFDTRVLYRENITGEPNYLNTDIDTNGKRILNLPAPGSDNEPARLKDVTNAIAGVASNTANLIGFSPTSVVTSTNVQGAINEVGSFSIVDGGISRSVKEKLREDVSVLDFASLTQRLDVAARTKVLNLSPAFQSALDYLKARGGGKLRIPNGSYRIESDLLYDANDLVVEADSGVQIFPYGCNGFVFGNPLSTTYTEGRRNNITLHNVVINLTNATGKNGVSVYNTDEVKLENVSCFYGAKGIYFKYTYNACIANCVAILGSVCGLHLEGACDKTLVLRGQFGNSVNGVVIEGGKAITFIGTSIERNTAEGVLGLSGMRETTREWGDAWNFKGLYMERNCQTTGKGFISLGQGTDTGDYSKGHIIDGCYFNWDAGNPRPSTDASLINLGKVTETSIISNRYTNSTNYVTYEDTTFKPRIQHIDVSGEQRGNTPVRCEVLSQLAPVNGSVTTDVNGGGFYTLDLTPYFTFTTTWISVSLQNPGATGVDITYEQLAAGKYKIYVRGLPNTTYGFNGFVLGKLV